ncbi:MAG: monooxygenase [Desulfobacterales bacterium]|nr:MAG: monooxygenase [Desulfobacterales bacterium]
MHTFPPETDILIIGAGPAGLACAKVLAENGLKVVVVERKPSVGPKVCAGGITYSGLIKHIPPEYIEKEFPEQHIFTPRQRLTVAESAPIIATIDREQIGQWMKQQALASGAKILTGAQAVQIDGQKVLVQHGKKTKPISTNHLIGADGANSIVRRYLNIPTTKVGVGLNCFIPMQYEQMEWHLNPKLFNSGYAWIFPHRKSISIGAYAERSCMDTRTLKQNLIAWATTRGIAIPQKAIRAGLVNFDYQGTSFNPLWLIGEAAGLASGLTGEGIYPGIVSGQEVARKILDPSYSMPLLKTIVKKQHKHYTVLTLAKQTPRLCGILMDLLVLLLRCKLINFRTLEMAD